MEDARPNHRLLRQFCVNPPIGSCPFFESRLTEDHCRL